MKIIFGILIILLSWPATGYLRAEEALLHSPGYLTYLRTHSLFTEGVWVGERLVVVGEQGLILYSGDQGRSWQQAKIPNKTTLTAIYFLDDKIGWIVGHETLILKTIDRGVTWKKVHHNPKLAGPLFDVWFKDEHFGLAIGAYGRILRTQDGGSTWTLHQIQPQTDFHLYGLALAPDGALWIAGEAGHLYRSQNQGQTWITMPAPHTESYFGIISLENGDLLVYGFRGLMAISKNQGQTWQSVQTSSQASIINAVEMPDNVLVLAGTDATLLRGRLENTQFTVKKLSYKGSLISLLPGVEQGLWLFGEGGIEYMPYEKILRIFSIPLNHPIPAGSRGE